LKLLPDEWRKTYAATQMSATQLDIIEQANGGMRCSPEENDRRGGAPYQHVNLRDYDNIKTNMTDEELVLIPTKDLNKVVKESGLNKEDVRKIKEKRRTLKNRGYAASCRVKRDCEEESLKAELALLERDVSELSRRCEDQKKKIEREEWIYEFRRSWALQQREINMQPGHLLQPPASTTAEPVTSASRDI